MDWTTTDSRMWARGRNDGRHLWEIVGARLRWTEFVQSGIRAVVIVGSRRGSRGFDALRHIDDESLVDGLAAGIVLVQRLTHVFFGTQQPFRLRALCRGSRDDAQGDVG